MSLLLVFVTVLSLLPVQVFAADPANPFWDVPQGSWYYDAVQYARVNGFFYGTSDTTFEPEGTMTRGMFVTVLGRMAGVDPAKYAGPSRFTDVPESAWYAPYVAWAHKYGVTAGTGEGRFSPDTPINRQQMAAFFVRYFEAFRVDYSTGANITTVPGDMDSVSDWAKDAVQKLWRQGLLSGDGVNFSPQENATRAQAASICYRTDQAVDTWYSEPGVPSTRVKLDPATGRPYGEGSQPVTPSKPSGGGSSGGSSGGGTTSGDSCSVSFYDGSRLIDSFQVKRGEPAGQVPAVSKSSKAGFILEGYYTDPNFTAPFYAENPVTGNMSVYARYESMGDAETLTIDSFARMDQDSNVSFRIRQTGGSVPYSAAAALTVKDGSDPVEIAVADNGDGTYRVYAPAGFREGCSYELNLAEGWVFVNPDRPEADTIRTAAFSIAMEEVENLSMNSGIRYIRDTEQINYIYTDKDNQPYAVDVLPSNADFTGGGSFEYDGAGNLQAEDILCIHVNGRPNSEEWRDPMDPAVYAKVSSVSGSTVYFEPLGENDRSRLYEIPDNFPIQVDALPAEGADNAVYIGRLDTAVYALMVAADEATQAGAEAKLNVGDFVTLYVDADAIASERDVYFGRITGYNPDNGEITYVPSTAQEIRESADLYTKVEMSGEDLLSPEEKAEIEQTVQAQVEASGFGEEAAYLLLDMAAQTDGFQNTAGLRDVMIRDGAGNELSSGSVQRLARSARNVGTKFELSDDVTLKVELITSGDQLHFRSGGVQLAIGVEAEFEVDTADEGKVHINLSATFVQEVAVDPSVKGKLVYKEILGFIPVPIGVQVNAIVDVKSFTAMSVKAEIFTEGPEDKSIWEKFQDFAKDPTALGDIPGLPPELKKGVSTVGDALKKIDEMKDEVSKKLEELPGYENYIADIWEQVEAVTNGEVNREEWEEIGENLKKTDITAELMNLMNLTSDTDLSVDYVDGLSDLMDRYSELLEKETDWVTLVEQEMFNQHTPEKFGVMIGIQGKFMVRADLNLAIGSNLQYEVGKRYNFWFRIGLFKPTSGSSTMDLIDESFAFQFYVMGKIGIKAGVRMKIYAAIGSVDAVSVGLTTELGPYLKLWGFFIYDYSKYRGANTTTWISKEQMAGALYLEFGLYLMVGVEAKALFLDYDNDFVDKEFPLLEAGDRKYYYDTAYEPLDDSDEIVVYNDGTAALQPGCALSMVLPEEAYALKVIDLTTGKQGSESLSFDNYTFKLSNPNFRIDNVGGKPVISVISVPQNVRLMQCDLTITYKHGKLAFSTYDMSTTVHLAWTNMTAAEYQQVYTASVTVPDGDGGREVIWSRRVRKGTPFDLPDEEEVRKLLSWSDAKYVAGSGYGSQPTEGVTLIENTQYYYDLGYQTYALTVTGIEGGGGSRTFTGQYGQPFDFSALAGTGANGPDRYSSFAGLMMGGETLALNQPINGKFAASNYATAEAQYSDETVTATFQFTVTDGTTAAPGDIEVTLRRGGTPNTASVMAAVPAGLTVTGFYPEVGPMDGDMTYQVVCEVPRAATATVTFNTNGGGAVDPVTRTVGAVLGALPAPSRTGYSFDGWFTDNGTFANRVDANTVVPEGGLTLYAKWTQGGVTVTFNTNGGVNLTENTKTVAYGQPYGALPTPERSGFSFQGWFTAADETGTQVTADTVVDTTEAHTLYAHWGELIDIPSSVFDFGAQETFTYKKGVSRTAEYTFDPGDLAGLTEDSFTVSYTRLSDQLRAENTDEGAAPDTAGSYIARITREAGGGYAKFDQTYGSTAANAVLVINRATRDLSGITNDDFVMGEQGFTYRKVSLNVDDLDPNAYIIYTINQTSYNGVDFGDYVYNNKEVESGLLYDLYQKKITIKTIDITDDINYLDVSKSDLSVDVTRKTDADCTKTGADNADQTWYNETDTSFEIGTAEQLFGLAALVNTKKESFANKTVTLTADIDLSDYQDWAGIGFSDSSYDNGTKIYTSDYFGFAGTFDGNNHKITGISGSGSLFEVLGIGVDKLNMDTQTHVDVNLTDCQIIIKNLTVDDFMQSLVSTNMTKNTSNCYIQFVNCTSGAYMSYSRGTPYEEIRRWIAHDQFVDSSPSVEKFVNCKVRPPRTTVW